MLKNVKLNSLQLMWIQNKVKKWWNCGNDKFSRNKRFAAARHHSEKQSLTQLIVTSQLEYNGTNIIVAFKNGLLLFSVWISWQYNCKLETAGQSNVQVRCHRRSNLVFTLLLRSVAAKMKVRESLCLLKICCCVLVWRDKLKQPSLGPSGMNKLDWHVLKHCGLTWVSLTSPFLSADVIWQLALCVLNFLLSHVE